MAASRWRTSSAGSEKANSATVCIGAARFDHTWLANPATRERRAVPHCVAGKRAAPTRHPPSARLLLSPVTVTVRSGTRSAGLRNGTDPNTTSR